MPPTDLLTRQAMACYGGKVVVKQLDVLKKQLCILCYQDDEEAVHQSRVASRRLRACLDVFGPSLGASAEWHSEVRRITRSLGEARDLDVQMDALRRYLEGGDVSLQCLLDEMRLRRAGMNKAVRKASERFLCSRAARRMASCAEPGDGEPRAQAGQHLQSRLSALLELQTCLQDEKEVERHHAMRIAAKRLRYTMEIFGPLGGDDLEEALQIIKELQEALGEVHDRDVWIATIQGVKGSNVFGEQMRQERREWFARAQNVWGRALAIDLHSRVDSVSRAEEPTVHRLTALISDVHGNLPALRAVLRDAVREGADRALCAGDIVGLGPYPDESVNVLREASVPCVQGNFDAATAGYLLRGQGEFQNHAALASISFMQKKSLEWLDALPRTVKVGDVAMHHAVPWSLQEKVEPVAPEKIWDRVVREGGGSIIVLGHTHEQAVLYHRDAVIINPGAVGRQRDGDTRARYALLDDEGGVRLRIVAYDEEETAAECDACGLPPALGETFRRGMTLDEAMRALQSDAERAEEARLAALVSACRAHASAEGGTPEHAERVRELALLLFDTVLDKKLGRKERALLECAALLHDIGISEGLKGHHKASMRMIMAADLPFHEDDRRMVAVVARYHRRKLPQDGHEHYADMDTKERAVARKLAALLRAADGLDRTGGSDWRAEDTGDTLILRPRGTPSLPLQQDKTSLFRKEFARELRIA